MLLTVVAVLSVASFAAPPQYGAELVFPAEPVYLEIVRTM